MAGRLPRVSPHSRCDDHGQRCAGAAATVRLLSFPMAALCGAACGAQPPTACCRHQHRSSDGKTMTRRNAAALTLAIGIAGSCGCHRDTSAAPPAAPAPPIKWAAVDAQRLAAREPDQWLNLGGDSMGTYYSPLKDINTSNVAELGFAWDYRLGTNRGQESTPLVVDGVMYATSNFGRVYALDAATGRELWKYDPRIDGQWARYACCDAVNRGLVAFDGRLYVGALDGWLHALDAHTGQLVWKVDTLIGREARTPYTYSGV